MEVPIDQQRDALVAALADALGSGLAESHVEPGVDVWVRVTAESWVEAGRVLPVSYTHLTLPTKA